MNKAKRSKHSFFWLACGPALLFATFILLFIRAAPLTIHIVWLFGLGISAALSCSISILAFREIQSYDKQIQEKAMLKNKEIEDMCGVLDETHMLYRQKVDHLENESKNSASEYEEMLAQKQKELEENKTRYEMLFADCNHHKAKSISLQHSLEEALSELRFARQSQFLIEENRKDLPMDIVHKYKQLRAQFEEKIKVLNSTRSDLFALQTDLFALQKNQEIEALEEEPLFEKLHHLLEENQALEEEIEALEQVTTTFLTKKSSTRTKKAQKLDKMLELQFDME